MLRSITVGWLLVSSAALAQTPILTRNADEPGRNAYQEAQLTNCTDPGDCTVVFAVVPTSRRRVVDYANCEVDLGAHGGLIGVNLGSQKPRLPRASLPFTTLPALPSRSIVNAGTHLYYEAGEQPRVDAYTVGAGTPFMLCTITGYDITLP